MNRCKNAEFWPLSKFNTGSFDASQHPAGNKDEVYSPLRQTDSIQYNTVFKYSTVQEKKAKESKSKTTKAREQKLKYDQRGGLGNK